MSLVSDVLTLHGDGDQRWLFQWRNSILRESLTLEMFPKSLFKLIFQEISKHLYYAQHDKEIESILMFFSRYIKNQQKSGE